MLLKPAQTIGNTNINKTSKQVKSKPKQKYGSNNKRANVARDIGGLVIETQHSGAKIVLKNAGKSRDEHNLAELKCDSFVKKRIGFWGY